MKKHNGISLIETLISLTIVGLSIVALLPVMTIKKEANDPSKGNRYWLTQDGTTKPNPSDRKVIIGSEKYDANDPAFVVDARGFGNQNISPLHITSSLNYGSQAMTATGNTLHFKAGKYGAGQCAGTSDSTKNFYIDENKIIIENNPTEDASVSTSFCSSNGLIYYNKIPVNDTTNLISIKRNNTEYIHVNNTNNIIGIGERAVQYTSAANNPNTIVIANRGASATAEAPWTGIAIGAKNAAGSLSEYNKFVIHSTNPTSGTRKFNISATISAPNGTRAQTYTIPSDKNLKTVLHQYHKGLNEITKLKPYKFTYKDDENKNIHIGLIAQDLKKVFPESVYKNPETGYLSINTDGVFYALTNAIKELDEKNKTLEEQNNELEEKIAKLRVIRNKMQQERSAINE